jgi:methionyl-tRNA synthetase
MFARTWPADIHLIGKDILRFHAVYWPAMLMAGGVEPPAQVFAHGFLTVGGKKMSKTNLTGIHPFELIDRFGADSYRYFFMRETRFGEDGSFSWEAMVERHNADLANGLGNLASRVLAMLGSYFDGVVPDATVQGAEDDLPAVTEDASRRLDEHVLALQLQPALIAIWDVVGRANQYLVEKEPWAIAKDEGRRDELASVLYASAETLRILAILISPVMPGAAERLWEQLGIAEPLHTQRVPGDLAWGGIAPGTVTAKGGALFPRLDAE